MRWRLRYPWLRPHSSIFIMHCIPWLSLNGPRSDPDITIMYSSYLWWTTCSVKGVMWFWKSRWHGPRPWMRSRIRCYLWYRSSSIKGVMWSWSIYIRWYRWRSSCLNIFIIHWISRLSLRTKYRRWWDVIFIRRFICFSYCSRLGFAFSSSHTPCSRWFSFIGSWFLLRRWFHWFILLSISFPFTRSWTFLSWMFLKCGLWVLFQRLVVVSLVFVILMDNTHQVNLWLIVQR